MTWPSLPESTICLPRAKCSQLRCCVPVWTTCFEAATSFARARALVERVGDRLLEVHVLAGRDRVRGHLQVPVVGAPDQDRVDVLVLEDAAVVGVLRRRRAGDLRRLEHPGLVDVAHRHHLAAGQVLQQAHEVAGAPAGADHADADAVVRAEGGGAGEAGAEGESGPAGDRGCPGSGDGSRKSGSRSFQPPRAQGLARIPGKLSAPPGACQPGHDPRDSAGRSDPWRSGPDGRPSRFGKPRRRPLRLARHCMISPGRSRTAHLQSTPKRVGGAHEVAGSRAERQHRGPERHARARRPGHGLRVRRPAGGHRHRDADRRRSPSAPEPPRRRRAADPAAGAGAAGRPQACRRPTTPRRSSSGSCSRTPRTPGARSSRRRGGRYQEPTLVLFDGRVASACGMASAAVGPFYCPADGKVYLDMAFFRELDQRFGAPGRLRAGLRGRPRGRPPRPEAAGHLRPGDRPASSGRARRSRPTRSPSASSCRPTASPASTATSTSSTSTPATSRRGCARPPRSATT